MDVRPVTLIGEMVVLEPLAIDHIKPLGSFCFDENIWRWYPNAIRNIDDLSVYVKDAIAHQEIRTQLPFVIIERSASEVVGCTRYMNIDVGNKRVEIGSTWIDPKWQRTFVNTETKLLMLSHAFEDWKVNRVEFKTDALNTKSRNAILRLGALEEGTLRQHMTTETERIRDSVYFSVISTEWKYIKTRLVKKLRTL